jgi:hypothetical protein
LFAKYRDLHENNGLPKKNKDLSKMISSLEPLESVVKEYASFAELKEKRRYREELQREGE